MSGQWIDYQRAGNINAFGDVVIGGPDDLSTVDEVVGRVKRGHGVLAEYVELDAAVLDAAARIVRVEYGDATGWLATQPPRPRRTWFLQIWMHWPDLTEYTFPGRGDPALRIIVDQIFIPTPVPPGP